MVVYDVVQLVSKGAYCSYRPGKWLVESHDDRETADERANRMNACATVPGIHYEVEAHDEMSIDRAPMNT